MVHQIDTLRAALAARAGEIAEAILGAPSYRSRTEPRWGRKGYLALSLAGPKRGLWHDHERGEGGDLFALIMRERNVRFADAVRIAREMLGEHTAPPPPPPRRNPDPPERERDPREESRLAFALRVRNDAKPAEGTIVETYLRNRGLALPDGDVLRFHPRCPRGSDRLRDEKAKMMLGRAGVIRVVPGAEAACELHVAEGMETALAVAQRLGAAPVWATASAAKMAALPVLDGFEAITVFADADEAGLTAALACARRWAAAGRRACVATPPVGDWADRPGEAT